MKAIHGSELWTLVYFLLITLMVKWKRIQIHHSGGKGCFRVVFSLKCQNEWKI